MTGEAKPIAQAAVPLTRARVAAYLKDNPDFLARHPELWEAVPPPRRVLGDGVADLQAAMIERLRADVRRLEDKGAELARQARDHRSLATQVHKAALAMMAAPDFAFLIETVTTDLASLLGIDVTALAVEADPPACSRHDIAGVRCLPPETIATLMRPGEEVSVTAEGTADARVFGAGAGLVRSFALARLGGTHGLPPALLALGARAPGHFRPGRGEDLVGFLARVLEQCVRARLNLPC